MGCEQLPPKYDEDLGDWPDVDLVTELQQAQKRIKFLETCCVIEAMLANPNVDSLIQQHEKRIAELEAEVERLRGVLSDVTADTVYEENERLRKAINVTHLMLLEGKYGSATIEIGQALEDSDE